MSTTTVYLKIDPQYAAAWVDPQTIRFGFSKAALELSCVTEQDRTLISSLLIGTTMEALKRTAKRSKISEAQFQELLKLLTPVLQASSTGFDTSGELKLFHPTTYQLSYPQEFGASAAATASALNTVLAWHGHQQEQGNGNSGLLLTINRFLLYKRFNLGYFTPHGVAELPLTFSDNQVHIGPLLTADAAPCSACADNADLFADPEKEIMAPQLLEHTPATENLPVLKQISPFLAQLVATPFALLGQKYVFDFGAGMLPIPQAIPVTGGDDCFCVYLNSTQSLAVRQ